MDQRDIDNLKERLDKVEAREEKLIGLVNTLEKAVDRISLVLEQIQDQKLEQRVRQMELDMMNEKMVSKAIQWLGVSIGGTAILLMSSYLFGSFTVGGGG